MIGSLKCPVNDCDWRGQVLSSGTRLHVAMLVTTPTLLGVWEALLYQSDLIHRPSAAQLSLTPSSAVHNLTDTCDNNNITKQKKRHS